MSENKKREMWMQRERCQVKKPEMGDTLLQTKEGLGPPKAGRGKEELSPRTFREIMPTP